MSDPCLSEGSPSLFDTDTILQTQNPPKIPKYQENTAFGAVSEYCWLCRLVSGMAQRIDLQTGLGDTLRLRLSPSTVGSPDWFRILELRHIGFPNLQPCLETPWAFMRTFSKSLRELFSSCLWHKSGTQRIFFRKTSSYELFRSWFLGSGFGQQLFSFRSPAVHWMAWTSSLNCLSCRNPYQTPHSLNPSPLITEKHFFHWIMLRRIPFPKIGSYFFILGRLFFGWIFLLWFWSAPCLKGQHCKH